MRGHHRPVNPLELTPASLESLTPSETTGRNCEEDLTMPLLSGGNKQARAET
jgi:hypothetical protein